VSLVTRHLLPAVLIGVALALMVGFFAFARPQYSAETHENVKIPRGLPAADESGAAGWVWPKGVPGWEPGQMLGRHHDFNVSGVQPVEVAGAQLAAARAGLDSNRVRVLVSSRAGRSGVLAILAAPALYETPARTCLATLLQGDAPVRWVCPGSSSGLDRTRVLVAATTYAWPEGKRPLYLVGVARGDVQRVVLAAPGLPTQTLYERGASWGQFQAAVTPKRDGGTLRVYDKHGLAQTLSLRLEPGTQRVLR